MKTALCALALFAAAVALAWAQDSYGSQAVTAHQATIVLKGEGALADAQATVTLPAWFESQAAASGRIAVVSCKGTGSPLAVSAVVNGVFTVTTNESGSPTQPFNWIVVADRR